MARLRGYVIRILLISGIFGFDRNVYMVDENVSPMPGFQVCVELSQGQLAVGEEAQLEVTIIQTMDSTATGIYMHCI